MDEAWLRELAVEVDELAIALAALEAEIQSLCAELHGEDAIKAEAPRFQQSLNRIVRTATDLQEALRPVLVPTWN
ncbi:MAG: hypothetical protein HY332_23665 [Chloroflexi bacterium]|nr:hypothetical protein [Chloroflexota bacterium]